MDAGIDAGPVDAGVDAGPADAGSPPQVDAGPSSHWLVGRRYVLAGSASDVDGDPLTVRWTQRAGPAVPLSDAGALAPYLYPPAVGTYVFELTASDGRTAPASASTSLVVHDLNGGEAFSLALEPDASVWAWGANGNGALGNGGLVDQPTPGRVCAPDPSFDGGPKDCAATPLTGAVAISTGREHALALRSDGTVWAWGFNGNGELGNGDVTYLSQALPVPVCSPEAVALDGGPLDCWAQPLSGVVAIAAGYQHSVALLRDGRVVAWGYNWNGEVGNGTGADALVQPQYVCAAGAVAPCTPDAGNVLGGIVRITAGGGGHSLAISDGGAVFAWGHNKNAQCGNGDSNVIKVTAPQPVCAPGQSSPCASFLTDVQSFDVWSGHSLAIDAQGGLWAWGSNNDHELGGITTAAVCRSGQVCAQVPTRVCASGDDPCTQPLVGVRNVAAGRRFSLAALEDGGVLAWGTNAFGQLGNGTTIDDAGVRPERVCGPGQLTCTAGLADVAAVAAGSFHAFALTRSGQLYVWGINDFGQLGIADAGTFEPLPLALPAY